MQRLVTAWVWTLWVLIVLVGFPVVGLVFLCTAPFDPGRYAAGRTFRWLGSLGGRLNPWWDFHTEGHLVRDPRRPYVAVSNHESYADIFLLSHLPWEMKWLAKQTIFNIPVMGWVMRMAGDVPLVRGNRESAVGALARCRDRLSNRVSVMIFPEGTRSHDGELKAFKDGAFRLAIEAGVPILPLAVNGAYTALHKGDWRFDVTNAEVRVLEPIPTEGLTLDDLPHLRERARGAISAALATMR